MTYEPSQQLRWLIGGVSTAAAIISLAEIYRLRRKLALADSRWPSGTPDSAEEVTPEPLASPLHPIAGVELGGTTSVAALCHPLSPTVIIDRFETPTTTPDETIAEILDWLEPRAPFSAIGVASFGPVDLHTTSPTYGSIMNTPKKKWAMFPLLSSFEPLAKKSECHIAFDTDVNAPAMAELAHFNRGSGSAASSCAYITVGTGVGVGLVVNGGPVHGLMHPEGGHVMPTLHPEDTYRGWTALHPTSVESMAAAQACAERCGVPMTGLPDISDDDPAWDFVAYYIAQLCVSITFLVSPHFIVISGGVMKRMSLFPKVRTHFEKLNDGYIDVPKISQNLDSYIVSSSFRNDAGIIGAFELGRQDLVQRGKLPVTSVNDVHAGLPN